MFGFSLFAAAQPRQEYGNLQNSFCTISLQLVMSSDQFSSIHEPLMCLDLDVGGQDSARKVSVEMNKADLQKFISSLEAANKV